MKCIAVVGNPGRWSTEQLADALEARTGFRCVVVDMGMVSLDLETERLIFSGSGPVTFRCPGHQENFSA